jgi:energy-converting hydrogenase A subunit M
MEKVEVQLIAGFLSDVYEGICEGDDTVAMQQQLTELYRVIRLPMNETFIKLRREV